MITKNDFKTLFETWEWIVDVQTQGLSYQDLFLQPQPGGNSMMWVLGHMVESMKDLILTMGGEVPDGYQVYKRFERTSEPILKDEPDLPDLAKIRHDYAALSAVAAQTLENQSDSYFREPGWSGTKGATTIFLAFHMSYHAGQLEYLRNLAGKTEKVI